MTGENDHRRKEAKGFAGLSDLVPDIDATPPPAARSESGAPAAGSPTPKTTASSPPPIKPPNQNHPRPVAPPSSSDSSARNWALGVALVLGVAWLVGQSDKKPSSRSAGTPGATTQSPTRPEESKPPIGQDLVFSTAQIRYCLAEDIRMDAAKSVLNNYSDSDVDQFNAMVSDYNSRCGSFRYRSGALESARRDIEPYRSQLQTEGRSRFARSPPSSSLAPSVPSRPAPDVTVLAIQQRLYELGYDAGTVDGLMGRTTRSAIINFQRDVGISEDGQPDAELLSLLNSAASLAKVKESASSSIEGEPEQIAIPMPKPARVESPPQENQPASASRDTENLSICLSGQYTSLCNYSLLTTDEKIRVAAAERQVNFQICVSGNYPSLCKRALLTQEEVNQVISAERRANLQTCLSGNYASLCNRSLLTQAEASEVADAERRVNFQTCASGNYPSLCKHSLLAPEELAQVRAAEKKVNFETCISGIYPSLCKHALLTTEEAASVANAERQAGSR